MTTYTIYCKVCEKDTTFDFDEETFETMFEGHIMLNCHGCNDYSVYIGGNDGTMIRERYRYDKQRTNKALGTPVKFSFGHRNDK